MLFHEEKVTQIVGLTAKLSAYIKNAGLNSKLKTSLKVYTKTRWNSVFTMLDAIANQYQDIYDLLVYKQRIVNECRLKRSEQPENSILDFITALNLQELKDIRDFLKPFKVGSKRF